MLVPAVRRIVVGVDGSAESAAALRWACREAGLRGAEVHAVHVQEVPHMASYAAPAQASSPEDGDAEVLWRTVMPDNASAEPSEPEKAGVPVHTEVALGLAARVLLERCDGADMLVLGTAGDQAGAARSAGPVIRACLRRSPCPVVVISTTQDCHAGCDPAGQPAAVRVPEPSESGPARERDVIPIPAGLLV